MTKTKLGSTKVRVQVTYAPTRVCYLIVEGEQQSCVLWDNGVEQYISNKFIKKLTPRVRL